MHASFLALATASFFLSSLATAQQTYVIDPDTVSDGMRQYWCDQQQTQCPLICLQTTPGVPRSNDCTASTLTYACVCSDGLSPNLTQYSQTLPFFICQEWGNQCQANCGNDGLCASECRSQHPCGAQHPVRVNVSAAATASASATANGGVNGGAAAVQTGFATNPGGEGGDGDGGQGNVGVGRRVGWALLGAGFAVGFGAVMM